MLHDTRPYWTELVDIFRSEPVRSVDQGTTEEGYKLPFGNPKWALGNLLAYLATQSDIDTLIELASDHRHGDGRNMLMRKLQEFGDARAKQALQGLVADPQVGDLAEELLAGLELPTVKGS